MKDDSSCLFMFLKNKQTFLMSKQKEKENIIIFKIIIIIIIIIIKIKIIKNYKTTHYIIFSLINDQKIYNEKNCVCLRKKCKMPLKYKNFQFLKINFCFT